MPHLDEGTIHALLDGALPDEERANVERHVAGCESCAAAVAEARGFVAGATRILSALDDAPRAALPGRGSAGGGARSLASRRSLWHTLHFTPARAAAAAVLIVAAGTFMTVREAQKSGDVARLKHEAVTLATDSSSSATVASVPSVGAPGVSAPLQPPPPREAPVTKPQESKKLARPTQTAEVAAAPPAARLSEVARDDVRRPIVMREEPRLNKVAATAQVAASAALTDSASSKLRADGAQTSLGTSSIVGCYAIAATRDFDKDASTLPSLISLDSTSALGGALAAEGELLPVRRERNSFAPTPPAPAAVRAPAAAGARAPAAAPTPAPVAAAAGDAAAGRTDSIARAERPRAVSVLAQPGDVASPNVQSAVRGYWRPAADGSVLVRLPSVAGAAPRSLVLRAEPNGLGLSGTLQESGRSVPISLRRVTCR